MWNLALALYLSAFTMGIFKAAREEPGGAHPVGLVVIFFGYFLAYMAGADS